ncbi:MAG: hypothetical protein J6Z01_00225 [Bacteroidales bacterium]|nr:hypothetical protein [Bacteroidales bacterium]
MIKIIIQVALAVLIIFLGYCIYDSIMQPIRFQNKASWRYERTKQSLINIRDAQVAFKSTYGKYTDNFDTLENFVKNGELKIVKAIGNIPDSFFNKYPRKVAEMKAIEAGIVRRDTVLVSCYDSLCQGKYILDSLRYVPLTGGKIFELDTSSIKTASSIIVPVFEAKAHNDVYMLGLDRQEIINKTDEQEQNSKYPGLKVGSLTEINNNAGNWE